MRLVRFASVTLLALASVIALANAAGATGTARHQHTYVCTGGNIPPGHYGPVLVAGVCYIPSGSVVIDGNLTIAPNAMLDAIDPPQGGGGLGSALPGNVAVRGDIRVGRDAALLLGCGPDICVPPVGTSDDRVDGDITARGALAVIVHNVTIGGSVSIVGGGGGPAYADPPGSNACLNVPVPLFNEDPQFAGIPVFSDLENNIVRGSIAVVGLQTCWFGELRNNVRRNVLVIGNTFGDSDADEVVGNNIHGGIACFGNNVAVQYGESGATPNIVRRFARGQCGFDVLSPDPNLPPGTAQPISVKAGHHQDS